ncbi:MAG TPA: pyruvate kinase [Candidatus Moranbacteria bacterium]|nr:pyruvate kinase [Candidatus Moranbacteria bacterium]
MKKTKIVATIGPASESEKTLEKMMKAGMNVARLNFSHGAHEWHKMAIDRIRKVAKKNNLNVSILADLQGPRIRVNTKEEIVVKSGAELLLYEVGEVVNTKNKPFIFLDKKNIASKLKENQEILIEDGLIKLKVVENKGKYLITKVIDGGTIKNHKGVNIPGADLDIEIITPKDRKDLEFSLENDVDFVAISFVKNGENIRSLRKLITKKISDVSKQPKIVSKIERKEAIDNLEDILRETDVVMVARGDLGIEMDESRVVILQKEIIAKSIHYLKPVIVATQMLDSMINNPRPTRAEVGDVSNAVIDHADAVMLSGESANGKYPVEAVEIMGKIIEKTEDSVYDDVHEALECETESCAEYVVIVRSAYELAKSFNAQAMCAVSVSGYTAKLISHFRPTQKIIVATNNSKSFRQLSILWGVNGYLFKEKKLETLIDKAVLEAKKDKKLKKGDKVVVIMGRVVDNEKMRLVGVKKVG